MDGYNDEWIAEKLRDERDVEPRPEIRSNQCAMSEEDTAATATDTHERETLEGVALFCCTQGTTNDNDKLVRT